MKQKFSSLFVLLVLLLTGLQVSAQSTPKPFDIEQPSLRVFLPAPELATGRAVVACPGGGYSGLAVNHEGYDWAPYFNKQGIALIAVSYTHLCRGSRPDCRHVCSLCGREVWRLWRLWWYSYSPRKLSGTKSIRPPSYRGGHWWKED